MHNSYICNNLILTNWTRIRYKSTRCIDSGLESEMMKSEWLAGVMLHTYSNMDSFCLSSIWRCQLKGKLKQDTSWSVIVSDIRISCKVWKDGWSLTSKATTRLLEVSSTSASASAPTIDEAGQILVIIALTTLIMLQSHISFPICVMVIHLSTDWDMLQS